MATTPITLNIDNTLLPTAVSALCWKGGYQATINGQPNPQTTAQFAKQQLGTYVKNAVVDYQAMQAQQAIVAPDPSLIT